jgi:PAS domain S-box-containing protein
MTADSDLINMPFSKDVLYYQALLAGIDDVVISTDTNFIIQTWNIAAEKIYNLPASEAIGKRTTDVMQHKYINATDEEVIKKLVKENHWNGLVKVVNSAEDIFLQTTFSIVKNTNGKKIGYIGISRDVTDEIKTKKSLQNFVSVLMQLEESFLIVDKNYKVSFACPKKNVQNFFNSDYKAGDDAFKYIPQTYLKEIKKAYQRAFAGETINYDIESDGEPKLYFNITYSPLKDDFGNIISVCVIIKDLTDQKEIEFLQEKKNAVEKNLYESRLLFEEFMENSPLLGWVADAEGVIHYMNQRYLKSFEDSEEIIGKNILELYPKKLAEEYLANNKTVLETGSIVETIEEDRQPSQLKAYKTIKFPIYYKGCSMIAGWAVDISDQITAQENLLQLNQHKNKLLSVIAHDLRAPLGVNASFLKSLIKDFETYSAEELLESIQIISKSFMQCYELVDELLRWGRIQLEHIKFNPLPITIQTEILKVTDTLLEQANRKKVCIETEFNFCGDIFADADMFAIVLRNFITNAIKFSHLNSTIKITTELINDKVKVNVIDNGIGMKDELVKKLLEKLNYESEFGTKGEKGTGLGLIIAKDYIEQNGGKFSIESKVGAGSNFNFTVPVYNNQQ